VQAKKLTTKDAIKIAAGHMQGLAGHEFDLLSIGKPVFVSVERESTAVPVPEKVFEDMRSCGAGVIHVGAEGKYHDWEGKERAKLNDNVLIEIGAAMSLYYGKKVILVVERGVRLPSNLQGLYRCQLNGDRLDRKSETKLRKTLRQFC
jgi:Predicted nucleotide-binding protein containing TIR-like domain